MRSWATVMGLVLGLMASGCATVDAPPVESGPYQAGWIGDILGQEGNVTACLSRFPSPAAVFHASELDGNVLGLMVVDGRDETHACTVQDGAVLEVVSLDVTLTDLSGSPRYVPGEEEPEYEDKRAYRSEGGAVVGWVYWR